MVETTIQTSRRNLLQRAGWALAATALSTNADATAMFGCPMPAEQPISPVMARLSTYISEARNRVLPSEVIEKAKQHIVDTFAAMVSGSQLLPGKAAIEFARVYGGHKIA